MEPKTLVALTDPAYLACLQAAAANQELVANFDRLTGANLSLQGTPLDLAIDKASGRLSSDLSRFMDFVRDTVYERVGPEVLRDLRSSAA